MGACNSSSGSYLSDDIPSSYMLTSAHFDLGEMTVQTEEAEAMVDDDGFPWKV